MKEFRGIGLALLCGLVTLGLDQASKAWALLTLEDGLYRPIIDGFLGFQLHFNPGAAFSFLTNGTWLFTLIAVAAVVGIPFFARSMTSRAWIVTTGVVWGGAAGNLADRIFRRPGFGRGHVVDFISYADWFIGNVADIALVVGICVMVVLSLAQVEPRSGAGEGIDA